MDDLYLATPHQYEGSLREPRWSLRNTGDPNLIGGHVVRGPVNAPVTDSLAAVYEFSGCDGTRYALRCFLPGLATKVNLPLRWKAIGEYFQDPAHDLAGWTVPFRYYPDGVQVRLSETETRLCPLVVMEWVEGQTLIEYLDVLLADPMVNGAHRRQVLTNLIKQVVALLAALHAAETALGDWAGSNIMVRPNGSIVVIDYDFAFIPAFRDRDRLAGRQPGYGHRWFERRDVEQLIASGDIPVDERADRFSGLVILTALLALRDNPRLWRRFGRRHQRRPAHTLLFDGTDLAGPDCSELFDRLSQSDDRDVQRAQQRLRSACYQPPGMLEPPHMFFSLKSGGTTVPDPPYAAAIRGGQLVINWDWPWAARVPLSGVLLVWRPSRFADDPNDPDAKSRILAPEECHGTLSLPHEMAGCQRLYLALFPAPQHGHAPRWQPAATVVPSSRVVVRRERVAICRLARLAGSATNFLEVRTVDQSPLPILHVVRSMGSVPLGLAGHELLATIGGQGESSAYVALGCGQYGLATFIRVLPQKNDESWVRVRVDGAARYAGALRLC